MEDKGSILKWLIAIFLIVICIICFVLCFTLGKNTTQSTKDTSASVTAPASSENNDDNYTTPIPADEGDTTSTIEYSQFPRAAKVLDDYTIGHIGGSKADSLLDTYYLSGNFYALIAHQSTDHDFKQGSLGLAKIEDDSLCNVVSFGTNEIYIESTLTTYGITVLTYGTKLNIYAFDLDLNQVSKTEFDLTFGTIYETSDKILIFGIKDNTLYAYSYSPQKTYFIAKIFAPYSEKISCVLKTDSSYAIILEGQNKTNLFSFSSEFSNVHTFDGKFFDACMSNELIAIVTSTDSETTLQTLNYSYALISNQKIQKSTYAKFYPVQSGFLLFLNDCYINLCKHFDIILQHNYAMSYDEISITLNGDIGYLLAQKDNYFDLIEFENFKKINVIETFSAKPGYKRLFEFSNKIVLFFTNSTIDSYFSENFGESDVFYLTKKM